MPPRLATERIVAAIDFSDDWQNVVAHAAGLARLRGSALHLVHVVQPPNWLMGQVLGAADLEAHQREVESAARQKLDEAIAPLAGIDVRASVVTGKPSVETLTVLERD